MTGMMWSLGGCMCIFQLFWKRSGILGIRQHLHRRESVKQSFRNLKSHSDSGCLPPSARSFPSNQLWLRLPYYLKFQPLIPCGHIWAGSQACSERCLKIALINETPGLSAFFWMLHRCSALLSPELASDGDLYITGVLNQRRQQIRWENL